MSGKTKVDFSKSIYLEFIKKLVNSDAFIISGVFGTR